MSTLTVLLEQFEAGAISDGVWNTVYDELLERAPAAERVAPLLLDLVERASDQGLFAVATLAVALASDPGYRPVVERILDERPLADTWRWSFYGHARELPADAVAWWFDALDLRRDRVDRADFQLTMLIRERIASLWPSRGEQVIEHLLAYDRGPGFWVIEAVESVLVHAGPHAALEATIARWIDDGRFDGSYDEPDGTTSIVFLAGPLERCVRDGSFDVSWALLDRATGHLWDLLGSTDRRSAGLLALAELIEQKHTMAGRLPADVLPVLGSDSPEAGAVRAGFIAVHDLERRPDREWDEEQRLRSCARLRELARGRAVGPHNPWDASTS